MNSKADLEYYNTLIPEIYPNAFPAGFKLRPANWALEERVVEQGPVVIDGKPIRRLLTMDVEFLSNDIVKKARAGEVDLVENYPCGLKCPGCFSEEDIFGDKDNLMTWQETMSVLDDARDIGLHSIKFLGPGEMFQNPDLFDILDACEERELYITIFTKGAELGDDTLAKQNYGSLGIHTSQDLVERIAKYSTVRFGLGFNSFDANFQNALVGSAGRSHDYVLSNGAFVDRGVADYTTKRDIALANLVNAGFNDPKQGQRLTLVATPTLEKQKDEIPDMYEWAARRNMPIIIAPTMESGPKTDKLVQIGQRHPLWIEDLYVAVYERALEIGAMSLDQIEQEGVSTYAGTDSCRQIANGGMVRANGQFKICPGSSRPEHIYGNVHQKSILDLWVNCPHYGMGALMNNGCPAKQSGVPDEMRYRVLERLKEVKL